MAVSALAEASDFHTCYDNKNYQPGKRTGHLISYSMVTSIDQCERLVQAIYWVDCSVLTWTEVDIPDYSDMNLVVEKRDFLRPQSYAGGV